MPLDPEVAALLERQKGQPPRSSLDVAATRQMMRRAAALAGPAPDLPRIEDFTLAEDLAAPGPRCRQYWPAEDPDLPLVVYFHGGRFFSGDLESHDATCRLLSLASGCRLLAVDYRMPPEHRFPAAFEDALAAVDFALALGVPVGVAGDSAGANLATGAALARRAASVRCQLLIYPMLDPAGCSASYAEFARGYGPGAEDMLRGWREYLSGEADRRDPRAAPLLAEDVAGSAPAFVMTAGYDTLRDEGEEYARKLIASGAMVWARRYSGMIHGFFTMTGVLRVAREAMEEAGSFLREKLR